MSRPSARVRRPRESRSIVTSGSCSTAWVPERPKRPAASTGTAPLADRLRERQGDDQAEEDAEPRGAPHREVEWAERLAAVRIVGRVAAVAMRIDGMLVG